jgi:hypothetical protein
VHGALNGNGNGGGPCAVCRASVFLIFGYNRDKTKLLNAEIQIINAKSSSNIFMSLNGDVHAPLMLKIATPYGGISSKAVLHSILALPCLDIGQHAKAAA